MAKANYSRAKEAAGYAAAELVQHGMVVGLGTGSTATYFIKRLIERCREGLKIQAVATSVKSMLLAAEGGIPLLEINSLTALDLDVDGADEIDPKKRMIKGGGGALVREKIIASMSAEMIVVVDRDKLVEHLGKFPLPVEIISFGYRATVNHLERLGYRGVLRQSPDKVIYTTDNGNYIYDIHFNGPIANPEKEDAAIRVIPGVVDTGFFFHLAGRVIIGNNNGTVEILS